MGRFSFVAHMPDRPGAMHNVAKIVNRHGGNIERVHHDHRIDPNTVFFEVVCNEMAYEAIKSELASIGYLHNPLIAPGHLKLKVHLRDQPGELSRFLVFTSRAGANIAYLDYDDKAEHPDVLTVSLTIESGEEVTRLLDSLKEIYPLEIVEYDTTGRALDDTIFYVRFAQRLRDIIGGGEDQFLMRLLHDVNHIVQSLTSRGEDPKEVFASILRTGERLKETIGPGFYSDCQSIELENGLQLNCLQMPCGGNVSVIRGGGGCTMVDSGFGIYHDDLLWLLARMQINIGDIDQLLITHADADHAGGAARIPVKARMHAKTLEIMQRANRAYGSRLEGSILEEVYTHLINLFSGFLVPDQVLPFPIASNRTRGPFRSLGQVIAGGLKLEVLEGLGGHLQGQVFFLCENPALVFTGDTLINFTSFDEGRAEFNNLAKTLMTTVNVDSATVRKEREGLMQIIKELDAEAKKDGHRCLVCPGHGPISTLEGDELMAYGTVRKVARAY